MTRGTVLVGWGSNRLVIVVVVVVIITWNRFHHDKGGPGEMRANKGPLG